MALETLLTDRGAAELSSKRWEHCLRTADYALFLADHYGVDPGLVRPAALAHDLAREWSPEKIRTAACKDQTRLPAFHLNNPVLLHGFAAAWLLQEDYGVKDLSLLNAVRYHTTGHPCLDDQGLLLFAADYMEPGRRHLDDRDREALLAQSLEGMILSILDAMAEHLQSSGKEVAPDSRELYQKLKKGYNKPS
ncbi:MAG: bis(5'-nucleosyl)-tetraphosphatase (symmetrical) YqeK [Spirochaetales bacterium]|nr:bis(5'-nucleosyl)-tetraphosphatase (symmetrical) YqeK [Spirochaetales bacterium]